MEETQTSWAETLAISGKAPFDEFKTEQRRVVALAQKICKTEWDRVKVEG
jgi:hypothetical protein